MNEKKHPGREYEWAGPLGVMALGKFQGNAGNGLLRFDWGTIHDDVRIREVRRHGLFGGRK